MGGSDRRRAWTPSVALARAWILAAAVVATAAASTGSAPSLPEPSPLFGRVIYRAAKVAGFESLGITMIACRHRDPVPREFAVQFFDLSGRAVSSFGRSKSPPTPAGKKLVFVTDGLPFAKRDVLDVRLGHLSMGTARVVSDARVVRCIGKMRMDGGVHAASYRDEIGLVRDGQPLPDLGSNWEAPPTRP